MRLIKPWGLVRWDLVVRPRTPRASCGRVLDAPRGVVLRGARHLDGRLAVIWSQARRQLMEAPAAGGTAQNGLHQTPGQPGWALFPDKSLLHDLTEN